MKLNFQRFAIYLVFLTMPFTSAFSISNQISLSILVFSCAVFILLLDIKNYLILRGDSVNNFIIAVSIIGIPLPIIAVITSLNYHVELRFGHILARTLFYFLILGAIIYMRAFARCGPVKIKIIIEFTYFLTLIVCVIDALNLFGIIDVNLARGDVAQLVVSYGDLYRIRGPFEEPGYLGAFVAATLPIYLHISNNQVFKFIIISVLTVLLSLSANFVIWMFVYLILWFILSLFQITLHKLLRRQNIIIFAFVAAFIVLAVFEFDIFDIIYGKFLGKSYNERIESYSIIIELSKHPIKLLFGFGPGYFLSTDFSQPTSILVSTLIELGLLGLFIFLSIYFINIFMLVRRRAAVHLAIGCIAYSIFIMTTPGYYFPFYVLPLLYWTFFKATSLWPLGKSV